MISQTRCFALLCLLLCCSAFAGASGDSHVEVSRVAPPLTPQHESSPEVPVHQYLAGEASHYLPDDTDEDLVMRREFHEHIGNRISFSFPGTSDRVVTYTGRRESAVVPATWIPTATSPCPYSEFQPSIWRGNDLEFADGNGNQTIGDAAAGGDDIIEGVMEEDYFQIRNDGHSDPFFNDLVAVALDADGLCIFLNHFWERPSNNGSNEAPLRSWPCGASLTAYDLASLYWSDALSAYARGALCPNINTTTCSITDTDLAYYYLGRVTHLLLDMSVPAHTLCDAHGGGLGGDDSYEKKYIGDRGKYLDYAAGTGDYVAGEQLEFLQYSTVTSDPGFIPTDPLAEPTWNAKSPLYKLFWYTAEKTDDFDSDGRDGEGPQRSTRQYDLLQPGARDIVEADLKRTADALMPHALKTTAELYYLFWHLTHPLTVTNVVYSGMTSPSFRIEFNTAVSALSTTASMFSVTDAGGKVWPTNTAWEADRRGVALTLIDRVPEGTNLTLLVSKRLKNFAENAMAADWSRVFTASSLLTAQLTATPAAGAAPLTTNLSASVSGGEGTVNYTVWWDCSSATTSVATAMTLCGSIPTPAAGSCTPAGTYGQKCNGVSETTRSFSHVYAASGGHTAKVIVERGPSAPAESHTTVSVSCTTAPVPALLAPAAGATNVAVTPLLDWFDTTDVGYDVEVCSLADCANVLRQATVQGSQWTVSPALNAGATFYFRVRALNGCGPSVWSGVFAFTTASAASTLPDFTIACDPSTLAIGAGGSGSIGCTVTSLNGFSAAVAISVPTTPSGFSTYIPAPTVTPSANGAVTSYVSFTATASVSPGSYSAVVQAASGGVIRTAGVVLSVTSSADVSISCIPSALTATASESVTTLCTVTSLNGFAGDVVLFAPDAPAGVNVAFEIFILPLSANMTARSNVTLTVYPGTAAGTYSLTIEARTPSLRRGTHLVLTVPGIPDFSVNCSLSSLTAHPGSVVSTTCIVASQSGFEGTVALGADYVPSGFTCETIPSSFALTAGSSETVEVRVRVAPSVSPGYAYSFHLTASAGAIARTALVSVAVTATPDFTLMCSPSAFGAPPGAGVSTSCTVTSLNGFSSTVSLACGNVPSGVSCTFAPASLTPLPDGTATTVLTVNASSSLLADTYAIDVNASSSPLTRSSTVSLSVLGSNALWARTFGGADNDAARVVKATPDGGCVVGGYTRSFGATDDDAYLVKLSDTGAVEWERVYRGALNDWIEDVIVLDDGGLILGGRTAPPPSGQGSAFWVARTDSLGHVLWSRAYYAYSGSTTRIVRSIQQTADGGFVATGETWEFGAGYADFWVVKLDSLGNIEWQKAYGTPKSDFAKRIRQTADGGYLVCGFTPGRPSSSKLDVWLVKLDSSGSVQWQKSYDSGGSEDPFALHLLNDGGAIVGSARDVSGQRLWLLRVDAHGNVVWQRVLSGTESQGTYHRGEIAEYAGNFLLATEGYSPTGGAGTFVVSFDAAGTVKWKRYIVTGGTANDEGHSIDVLPNGGILVAGSSPLQNGDVFVARLDESGSMPSCTPIIDSANALEDTSGTAIELAATTVSTTAAPNDAPVVEVTTTSSVTELCNAPAYDMALSCAPAALAAVRNASASAQCTVRSLNGFSGAVTLSCAELPPGVTCSFDPVQPSVSPDGAATSTLTVNVGAPNPGSHGFRAEAMSGTVKSSVPLTFSLISPLLVSAVPSTGPAAGDADVTIGGANFFSTSVAKFGGTTAVTTFVSSTELRAVTPPHAAGSVDVNVTNPDGQTAGLASAYSYKLVPSETRLLAAPQPAFYGDAVTLTATVPVGAAGTVTFIDGATEVGAKIISAASASFTTSSLAVGVHSLIARFSGDERFAPSESAPVNFTVSRAATATTMTSSLNPSTYGANVTFTASVTSGATGTVSFMDGGTVLLGSATLNAGLATVSTSVLTVGTHTMTSLYGGDDSREASQSDPFVQTVAKATTATTVASSLNPSTYGASVTFTASVIPNATGTVSFMNGGTVLLGSALLNAGVAIFSTPVLTAGTHTITALCDGDASSEASQSDPLVQIVAKAPTATSVTSSLNPSTYGASVTFTASVTSGATGNVSFMDGGAVLLGSASLNGGVATLSTSALSAGTHTITALYAGDDSREASRSDPFLQTAAKAPTTIVLTTTMNPSSSGSTVTFAATVTPGASGIVAFRDGTVELGRAELSAGTAMHSASGLASGAHPITAEYSGDSNFLGSTSAVLIQTVRPAPLPRGDANGDGKIGTADVFYLINAMFAGGPPSAGEADANADGSHDAADIVFLINYLFAGGPPPPP